MIRVADPTAPEIVGRVFTAGIPFGAAVLGNCAYIADGELGLLVVDVGDPENPVVVGCQPMEFQASSVAVSSGMIIVTDQGQNDGLNIAWRQCGSAVAVPDLLPVISELNIFPNPFNPRTTISFELRQPQRVRIEVYDIAGRRIARLADHRFAAGEVSVTWDGRDAIGREVPAGTYLIRRESEDGVATGKAALVR